MFLLDIAALPVYIVSKEMLILGSVLRLLVTANVVPSSPFLVTVMMKGLRSTETSVPTRATRRKIPEDHILHSHRRGNLRSYTLCTCLSRGWNNVSRPNSTTDTILLVI
jgi:hypothetical protein